MSTTSTSNHALLDRPVLSIVLLSLSLRIATSLLLVVTHFLLPPFDASAARLSSPLNPIYQPFVRWDTVYFLGIASEGYTQEQRLAFTPGLPMLLRGGAQLVRWVRGGQEATLEDMVLAGMIGTTLATMGAAVLLYKLTLELSSSRKHSFATALLFLLAPARAVLHAVPYTEPFAAFFTFAGMLAFVRHRNLFAALLFAVGSTFRAQGAMLGLGFFGWRYILEKPFQKSRFSMQILASGIARTTVLSLTSAAPFFAFQAYAYREFCSSPDHLRPWCSTTFGFSYGWIQSHYWDVGPFRYWTLLQLPNFLLASPVLVLSFAASYTYYSSQPRLVISRTLPFLPSSLLPSSSTPPPILTRPFLSPSLLPFIHLHMATTLLLLISSHVQIILRLCIPNPVVWWYVSDLLLAEGSEGEGRRRWGKRWIGYCVMWGTVATVSWALFLPPA
ncbi:hypothetical protein JCM5353_006293 [Sporobolomyces roseus]